MNILILAGGSGTRLWPASRRKQPKQLMHFIGDKTLLQNTYNRFKGFARPGQIYVGTLKNYAGAIQKQLPQIPKKNYSLEPTLKDRAPAIGLAALIMHHDNPESCFVTAWSDHYIKEEAKYLAMLRKAEKFLKANPEQTITVGIAPSFAHTGMGYIEKGKMIKSIPGLAMNHVYAFKEKPDLKTATRYIKSKKYLWNSGYFIWKTSTLLDLYKKHLPEIYALLMEIKPALGTKKQQASIDKIYPRMPKLDIEKGLIEKLTNRMVITADFSWADVGSWKVVKDALSPNSNLIKGPWVGIDTADSLVYNYTKKLVATAGTKDLIIVVTPDVVLVANKDSAEDIKKLTAMLEANPQWKKFL